MKKPAVNILTNKKSGTLYTGVTSNLIQRIYQHRNNNIKSFTSIYNCKLLVYYELFDEMVNAIAREKQIKAGSRMKKLMLIESFNPEWIDLYEEICT